MKSEHEENGEATTEMVGAASRRRLLGMGVAASPFVLTLASRPALGNECTNSALLSGNASTSARRDPNFCYSQELNQLRSSYDQQANALSQQIVNASTTGDAAAQSRLQGEVTSLQGDLAAQISSLRSKYRRYPGFNG